MDPFTFVLTYPLETAFAVFLCSYLTIAGWTLMSRLGRLPDGMAGWVRTRILFPLERVRVLGAIVRGTRQWPLSLGLAVSLGVGLAAPLAVIAGMVLAALALLAMVVGLVLWGTSKEDVLKEEPQNFHDYLDENKPFHPYGPANDIRSYDDDFMTGYGKLSRY